MYPHGRPPSYWAEGKFELGDPGLLVRRMPGQSRPVAGPGARDRGGSPALVSPLDGHAQSNERRHREALRQQYAASPASALALTRIPPALAAAIDKVLPPAAACGVHGAMTTTTPVGDPAARISAGLLAPLPVAPPLHTPMAPAVPEPCDPGTPGFPAWQLREFDRLAELLGAPGDRAACAALVRARPVAALPALLALLYPGGSGPAAAY
jgi:hypothetical protein